MAGGARRGSCFSPVRPAPLAQRQGIAAMLTIIRASLLGSALMLLGWLCERYTTINRSWVDCR